MARLAAKKAATGGYRYGMPGAVHLHLMELRYTAHSRDRMAEWGIAAAEIEAAISAPERVIIGQTAIEYDATVDGRPLHVVAVKGSEPPLIITVYVVRAGGKR